MIRELKQIVTMVYGILLVRLHLKYILWNKNIL